MFADHVVLHQVLQVEAVDGDHGIRNPITYSITGGPKHLFAINKLNGLVYINVSFLFIMLSRQQITDSNQNVLRLRLIERVKMQEMVLLSSRWVGRMV